MGFSYKTLLISRRVILINAIHLFSVVIEKLKKGALKEECPYRKTGPWGTFSCFGTQNGKWVL